MISKKIESTIGMDETQTGFMILGEKASGKTSLAFAYAYDIALGGGNPLYICNRQKIESQPPLMVKNMIPPSSDKRMSQEENYISRTSFDLYSRISMKYISSAKELKMLMAGLHNFDPKPSAVIIEDLSSILDPLDSISRRDAKFLDLCLAVGAFTSDAINYYRKQGNMVKLLITDNCNDFSFLHVMTKVTPSLFFLVKNADGSSKDLTYKRDYKSHDPSNTEIVYRNIHKSQDGHLFIPCF